MKMQHFKYFKKAFLYFFVFGTAVFFFLPVLYTIISSFKVESDILSWPPSWLPKVWTMENYRLALSKYNFALWMKNSIIVSVAVTIIAVVIDALAGYAFARLEFKGKKILFAMVVSMLLIPMQAYIVPMYMMFNKVQLLNTYIAVIQ